MATIFHRRNRWPLFWMLSRMRILGMSPEKRRKKGQKGKGGYTQKLWCGALDGQNEGHDQIPYRLADEVSLLIISNCFFDPVTVTIPIFCSSPLTSHSHILPVPTIRLESGADGSKTLTPVRPIACLAGILDTGEGIIRLFWSNLDRRWYHVDCVEV